MCYSIYILRSLLLYIFSYQIIVFFFSVSDDLHDLYVQLNTVYSIPYHSTVIVWRWSFVWHSAKWWWIRDATLSSLLRLNRIFCVSACICLNVFKMLNLLLLLLHTKFKPEQIFIANSSISIVNVCNDYSINEIRHVRLFVHWISFLGDAICKENNWILLSHFQLFLLYIFGVSICLVCFFFFFFF